METYIFLVFFFFIIILRKDCERVNGKEILLVNRDKKNKVVNYC
jgi:hypothetical protein